MDDNDLHGLLFSAIKHHNVSLLDDLLNGSGSKGLLNLPSEDGNMLLHVAVLENDLKCLECLLKHEANPNVFDSIKARTPLHLAVELGQTDIVKAFLELEHINLDIRDDRNLTCHEIAQFCDNQLLTDLIENRQKEIDKLKHDFYSVMNQACTTNQPNLVKDLLAKFEKRIIDKLPKGWSPTKDGVHFARSSLRELINWSSSSWNDVTLLFKSASKGYTKICELLIEAGATAKCNENTNYSPLYVAAYSGFTDTVKLLLNSFPYLIREVTIERWTVLHACCLQGHWETAKLILNYPYPKELMQRYISRSSVYEYFFAFDLNAQDAAGQTVIFLAVAANDEKLLDSLLQFNVEATLLDNPQLNNDRSQTNQPVTQRPGTLEATSTRHARIIPDRPKVEGDNSGVVRNRIDSQLDKIIKQLRKVDTGDLKAECSETIETVGDIRKQKYLICPFEMDTYCDYNSKTALHLAVCQQYHNIATTLLVNGSNPNLPILSRDSIKSDFTSSNMDAGLNWLRSSKSTCLKEACRLNDEVMCEILIRYGASDNQDNLALQVAATNKNTSLISKFLALKTNVDPEYKINKKCNVEFASRYKQGQKLSKSGAGCITTTFSSMFPSTPVMIDWQNLRCIRQIEPKWLIDASMLHNKRLKHSTTSLLAITRLDLSSNNLKSIHPVIFRLPSLRELNLSKNRLETLLDVNSSSFAEGDSVPTSKLIESHKTAMKRSKSSNLTSINLENSNIIDLNEPQAWDLPYLETLDLHDNRLISLPDCLFELPKLSELDVSSNQIRQLPSVMWNAPSLKEVIVSGNLLDDLPKLVSHQAQHGTSFNYNFDRSHSPTDERSSLTSNQSNNLDKTGSSFHNNSGHNSLTDGKVNESLDYSELSSIQLESSNTALNHLNHWKKKIEVVSSVSVASTSSKEILDDIPTISKINYINLSHNSFSHIPPVLACVASNLTRINLSYNRISSLANIGLYPAKLKNLDLSNNQISEWFTFSNQVEEGNYCYSENLQNDNISKFLYGYGAVHCPHKLHQRLDHLKSINLSYNMLTDIKIHSPNCHDSSTRLSKSHPSAKEFSETANNLRGTLMCPNITALDLSYNKIQQVPKDIPELKDLSVLNLSGNVLISSLPAELGLSTKLWNLGINGCNLNEPLKSIVESKTYKTIDIIGYLRSILEEARPYARMKLMLVGLQGIGKTSLLERMRQEGTTGTRRRAPEHWTKRMGHTTRSNIRNQKGVTLSTVGVDIHDWIFCKRTAKNQLNHGPVSFSTWDFGGQQEFYATHRYFLSKRSMYLVVWRLTDGLEGIVGIQQWLVNIQSRAPGSPVIIVGTHEDMIEGGERSDAVRLLQEEVHRRFIDISDHDKCGLPRVMGSIVVSTKTRLNIKNLCNKIYDIVFSLKCPGSHERLLEQKIPATYLYLEEIVSWIVNQRQQGKKEPVLSYEEYRKIASHQLKLKYNKTFRDLEPVNSREVNYNSELQQATRFLHENGILLHYEDANLRDLYFLDPQWLCDILSHVVTIREINPHVKNGLMKIDDLGFLFKSIDINLSGGIQSYVVNLLNKFEVALTWNSQYLLIPSLLPSDPNSIRDQQDFQVKMAPRARGRSAVRRYEPNRSASRATSIGPTKLKTSSPNTKSRIQIDSRVDRTIYRLIFLRYLPAGFLARLQSGILSDPIFDEICADLFNYFNRMVDNDNRINEIIGSRSGWICWKKGIKLTLQNESTINAKSNLGGQVPLLTIQEISTMDRAMALRKKKFKVESDQTISNPSKTKPEGCWLDFDSSHYSNIISVSVSNWRLRIVNEDGTVEFIDPEHQYISKILANAIDHIDNLLEDWYPSLGTRFAHTLGGNYLVTRIIPCQSCYSSVDADESINKFPTSSSTRASRHSANKVNFSISSASGGETAESSTLIDILDDSKKDEIYCYYVEHCILIAYNINSSAVNPITSRRYNLNPSHSSGIKKTDSRNFRCPKHGYISLSTIAPDIVFEDVPDSFKIESEQIERCKLIGRGTFGFVFKGTVQNSTHTLNQSSLTDQEVALKLLQPVDPGPEADQTDIIAYKSATSNWTREPFHCACKSYCTARHEVNILQILRHPNIVLFIGLCIKPLAIVLELAPMGCLSDVFKNYKRAGMRIDQFSIQKTILQVAKALEFLHQQRIIYRDLKAENVLVWSFPSHFATQFQSASVELKLADYGISRQALSTGIWKGFAGTINFLAPEILRHNGDEEYTEKVDCFSFGMFMYELLSLRPPFKHNEGMKSHLADGARPTLTMRELVYPSYMIDLMSICWAQEPHLRPTASQIISIASTPEFMQLLDVVALPEVSEKVSCSGAIQYNIHNDNNIDLWLGLNNSTKRILSTNLGQWTECHKLVSNHTQANSQLQSDCMCVVENKIWFCDSEMIIHVMPLGARFSHKDLRSTPALKNQNEQLNRVQVYTLNHHESLKDQVKSMMYVKTSGCVILLSNTGKLLLCNPDTMNCKQLDDSSIEYKCFAIQENTRMETDLVEDSLASASYRIFCGQSNGVSCLDIVDDCIYRQNILPLAGKVDLSGERIVEPSQSTEVTSIVASNDLLWTSAGCTVHLWSLGDKCVARKLDCWKLVPCSESLESINIESYYQQARTSVVTSMVYLNNQLFVGTSHGCFMVVEADSLKPMTVFRPYLSAITILAPTLIRENADEESDTKYLITIGSGYRDLMKRYVNSLDSCDDQSKKETSIVDAAILWSANYYNF